MKYVLKTSSIILLIFICVCLSACITVMGKYTLRKDRSDVLCVEIFKTEKTYKESDVDDLRSENTPICSLENEKCTAAIETLCKLEYSKKKILFPIPMDGGCDLGGYVAAVVYTDGSYDLIAEKGLFCYSENNGKGQYKYDYSDYSGERPFAELIEEMVENG